MYEGPKLERYGTFRELTQGGAGDISDPFTTDLQDACVTIRDPVTGNIIRIICEPS